MATSTKELTTRAKALVSERKYQEAVRVCRRALLSRPADVDVRLLLGRALLAMERYDEVRVEMLNLARKKPTADVYCLLAEAYLCGGQRDLAQETIDKALAMEPTHAEAREVRMDIQNLVEPKIDTIERWFHPDTIKTIETELDDDGHMVRKSLPPATTNATETVEPTIEVHPGYVEEAEQTGHLINSDLVSTNHHVDYSQEITVAGDSREYIDATPSQVMPAPRPIKIETVSGHDPHQAATREMTAQKISSVKKTHQNLSPPPSVAPPPRSFPPSVKPAKSFPPPLIESTSELLEEDLIAPDTNAVAFARPADKPTSELTSSDLVMTNDIEEPSAALFGGTGLLENELVDDLDEEATQARMSISDDPMPVLPAPSGPSSQMGAPSPFGDPSPFGGIEQTRQKPQQYNEDEQTIARNRSLSLNAPESFPAFVDSEDEPTRAKASIPAAATRGMGRRVTQAADAQLGLGASTLGLGGSSALGTPMPPVGAPSPFDPPPSELPIPQTKASVEYTSPPTEERPVQSLPAGFKPTSNPFNDNRKTNKKQRKITTLKDASTGTGIFEKVRALPRWTYYFLAGIPVLVVAALVFGVTRYMGAKAAGEIEVAVTQALDDGTLDSLQNALTIDMEKGGDSPEANARRAMLFAIASREHRAEDDPKDDRKGAPARERANRFLSKLDEAGLKLPRARIAQTYLALHDGNASSAERSIIDLPLNDPETLHAASETALALGNPSQALELATQAAAGHTSARYISSLQLLNSKKDPKAAIAALQAVPNAAQSSLIQITIARIAMESNDKETALKGAKLILDEMKSPTVFQMAWAHAIKGNQLLSLADLERADTLRAKNDEPLALTIAESFLAIGKAKAAQEILTKLPETASDVQRKTAVRAEAFLALSDFDGVEKTLAAATASPQTTFLQGRVAEAKGDLDAAKKKYEDASKSDSYYVKGRVRLGQIILAEGKPAQAQTLFEEAKTKAPTNPEALAGLSSSLVKSKKFNEAKQVIEDAKKLGIDTPELQVAAAEISLAQGRFSDALELLRGLATKKRDPITLTSLGDAARLAGKPDESKKAYEDALSMSAKHQPALIGIANVMIDARDVSSAGAEVARAKKMGVTGTKLKLLEARLGILKGEGNQVVIALKFYVSKSQDPETLLVYGTALVQAERNELAITTLRRVISKKDSLDARISLGIAYARRAKMKEANENASAAAKLASKAKDSIGEARALALQARISFDRGKFGPASEKAAAALAKDPKNSHAYLVQAMVAVERNKMTDAKESLRRAVDSPQPLPESLGLLVVYDNSTADRCELAKRYVAAAPTGMDNIDVRKVAKRCR